MKLTQALAFVAAACFLYDAKGEVIIDEDDTSELAPYELPDALEGDHRKLTSLYDYKKAKKHWPIGMCEGKCFTDDHCDGELKCFKRKGTETVPGCTGDGVDGNNYCYMPPSADELYRYKKKERVTPMGHCRGDCDTDDDCEGDLVCMTRHGDEPVPGCMGKARTATDYCVKPDPHRPHLEWCGEEPPIKLGKCQGDCDKDKDCLPGLYCFKRKKNRTDPVPGCKGEGKPGTDYCIPIGDPPTTPFPPCPDTPAPTPSTPRPTPSPTPPLTPQPTTRPPSPCTNCYTKLAHSGINQHWLKKIFYYLKYLCEKCTTKKCVYYKFKILENLRHQALRYRQITSSQNQMWQWCNKEVANYKLHKVH